MGQNCTSELPDTVLSEYLGDNEFGENADIDEIRIRNDALGTRNCKITLDVGKGIKSKKPSKKLVEVRFSWTFVTDKELNVDLYQEYLVNISCRCLSSLKKTLLIEKKRKKNSDFKIGETS